MESLDYVTSLTGELREIVMDAYVRSFTLMLGEWKNMNLLGKIHIDDFHRCFVGILGSCVPGRFDYEGTSFLSAFK